MLVIGRFNPGKPGQISNLAEIGQTIETGIDMLELTVSLTSNNSLVLTSPSNTKKKQSDTTLLTEVFDEFYGKILIIIKLKGTDTGKAVTELLAKRYIARKHDWDNVLLASFRWRELSAAKKVNKNINLVLLHSRNPFLFIAHYRHLKLTAVGFHRLYLNNFALEIAKRIRLFTYVYTVNRPETAIQLAAKGIDGVVTTAGIPIMKAITKRSSSDN